MKTLNQFLISGLVACLGLVVFSGCKQEPSETTDTTSGGDGNSLLTVEDKAIEEGDYVILDTLTDQFDRAKAKANAEDTLAKYPDIDVMVGLFAYNPPLILEALDQAGKLGEVQVVAFDEDEATLQGVKDGNVYGTVVQDPYMYGYKSIQVLNELHNGNTSVLPENKFINVPALQIRQDNLDEFWSELKSRLGGSGGNPAKEGEPTYAFVSNGVAEFWTIAKVGVEKAGSELGVNTEVLMPAEGTADQKRMIEDLITRGVDGIAVSPIDPDNQTELLNEAAAETNLITHDSDAPDSNRQVYIGVDNYAAGRLCGQLIKEAIPNGGKIMILVGRLEQDNARRRRQGVIDELLGRPFNPDNYDPPGQVLSGR